jgi:hypothetical protein
MTCPACATVTEAPEMVGTLTICLSIACLASLVVVEGEPVRRAVGADTTAIPEWERKDLIALRSKYRKARAA